MSTRANSLERRRKRAGLSRRAVAERAGVSPHLVYLVERSYKPRSDALARIERVLEAA